MKKPNLFILGAPKCGTTSLMHWLSLHPDVFVPKVKEPHYFSDEYKLTLDLEAYNGLFLEADDRHRWVCEASVWYLFSDSAVSNIEKYSPDARFVVMLRNPIDLSVSMHGQHRFNGSELVADLGEALALSQRRNFGEHVGIKRGYLAADHLAYYKSCALGWQLSRLYSTVPKERIHVIVFDDLASDPAEVYSRLLQFLDLSTLVPAEFAKINSAKTRKSFLLDALVLQLARLKSRLGLRRRARILSRIRRWNTRAIAREAVSPDLHSEMTQKFHDDVQLLSSLLNRNLDSWNREKMS